MRKLASFVASVSFLGIRNAIAVARAYPGRLLAGVAISGLLCAQTAPVQCTDAQVQQVNGYLQTGIETGCAILVVGENTPGLVLPASASVIFTAGTAACTALSNGANLNVANIVQLAGDVAAAAAAVEPYLAPKSLAVRRMYVKYHRQERALRMMRG